MYFITRIKSTNTDSELTETEELIEKNFKITIINMFKDAKKNMK